QLISIGKTSNEFKEIEALFHQTVKIPLKSVTRIQNKPLWSFYYMKKQAILKKKPGLAITKRLFHGTSEDLIDAICHQGFDFRLSGSRIGHVYGYGSYFARDASVSCGYTNSGQLFVVEVAVGEYTKGLCDYRRPPQKGLASLDLYDSCVNDPLNPSTFVIFDNHQAYPEYLIRY
ncbi:hypothetical protein HELRODRAFT_74866, partial [Helobdella robusta]|uniref:Poly [ADP-ribose] polymerase n=1 Tax=Helobdella robusta TaxID=6412 RepID=T1G1W6_HELRO